MESCTCSARLASKAPLGLDAALRALRARPRPCKTKTQISQSNTPKQATHCWDKCGLPQRQTRRYANLQRLLLEVEPRTENRYARAPTVASARDLAETSVYLGVCGHMLDAKVDRAVWFRRAYNIIGHWKERGLSLGQNCDRHFAIFRNSYTQEGDEHVAFLDPVPWYRGGTAVPGRSTPRKGYHRSSEQERAPR